jgi:chromosome segregation ATPase
VTVRDEENDENYRRLLDVKELREELERLHHSADSTHKAASDNAERANIAENRIKQLEEALREVIEGYEQPEPDDFDWEGWYDRATRAVTQPMTNPTERRQYPSEV